LTKYKTFLHTAVGNEPLQLRTNFITQVSPACDCYDHSDAPIVNDFGICASTDPVALDHACADLVNAAPGNTNTALKSGLEPGGDKLRRGYLRISTGRYSSNTPRR
jgi:uncharacterized Fe-S center protein